MEYEKPTSFQKKAGSSRHPYDGVFLSSVSAAKVGPRKSEYEEIFKGSGSSSIPVLDFDQGKSTRFDARIDYSSIFGDSDDFALPFEDSSAPSVRTRSPAEAGTRGVRTGHSSVSEEKQVPSPKESYESFDGVKQFNVSYNRTTNPGSKSVENGMAHVAKLDAVNGYSRLIDKAAPSLMNEGGKPVRSVLNDAQVNVDNVGEPLRVPKLPRRAVSGPQPRVAAHDAFPSHAEPRKRSARNRSISDDVLSDAFEIGLGMYSSGMPSSPLSATPEAASRRRSSIEPTSSKIGTSRSNTFRRAVGGRSLPSLDEDVDGNSIAAASAAAVRKAIEEAQAKIKVAKELMERKKEGRLNFAKFNFDNGLKTEKRDAKNAEKSCSSRENKGLDLNGKEVVMKDSGHLDNGLKMKKKDANVEKANSSSEKEGLEVNGKDDDHINLTTYESDSGLKAERRYANSLEESNSSRENGGREMTGKEDISKQSIARLSKLDEIKASQLALNLQPEPELSRAPGIGGKPREMGSLFTQVDHNAEVNQDGETRRQISEAAVANKHVAGALEIEQADVAKKVDHNAEVNHDGETRRQISEAAVANKHVAGALETEQADVAKKVDHNAEVNHDGETRRQISEAAVANKHLAGALETKQADVAKKVTPSADVNELVQNVTTEKRQMGCTKNVEVIEDDAKMGKVDNKLDPIQGLFTWIFSPNSITFTHEVEYEKEHILEVSAASEHGEAIQISDVMHEREQLESNLKGFAEQDKRANPEIHGQNHDMQEIREIIDRGEIADYEVGGCTRGEMETKAAPVLVLEDNQDTHGEIHEQNSKEKGDKCEMEVDCEVNQEEGPVVKELEKEKSDAYQEADTEMNLDSGCEEEVVEVGRNDIQGQEESDCRHSEVGKIEEYEQLEVVDKSERIADGDRQKDIPECIPTSTVETARIMPENCLINENEKATEAVQGTSRDQGSNFVVADVLCNQEQNENLSAAGKGHEHGETLEDVKVSAEIITSNQNNRTTGLTRDTRTNEVSGKDSKAVDVASSADEEGILEATCPAQGLPRLDGFNNETALRSESPGIKNAGYVEETDVNSEQKQTNLNCDERSIGLTRDPHTFEKGGKEYKAVEDASNMDEEEILEAEHKAVENASNVDEEGILEVTHPAQGFPTTGGFDDETTCRIDTPGIKKNEGYVNENNLNSEQKRNGDNFPRSHEDSNREKSVEEVIWESEENEGDGDGSELSCHSEESENCFMAGNTMESERLHEPEPMDSKRPREPELKEAVDSETHDMENQVEEVAFPLDEDMDADKSEISPVHGEEDNSSESSLEERWMNIEEHVAVHEHSLSERNWNTTEISEEEKSCHSTGREEENHHEVEDRETGSQMQTEVENPSHLEGEEAKEREMHVEAGQQPCSTEENGKTTRKFQEKEICRNARKDEENHHTTDEREAGSQVEIDVETQHHVKKGEAKEREVDKEREKRAVERAIREARERAFAEAQERAARAAVERAAADIRQKVTVEGSKRLEKAPAEANAKPAANKAAMEAKLKAERAAVERATAEARERALEKALAEKAASKATKQAGKIAAEKLSSASTDGAKSSNNAPVDHQQKGPYALKNSRHSSSSNHGGHWNKAELERQQKTAERAAKALAEKNMRDLLAQKEQAERNRLAETLDADVKRWSNGKERNLRALLSTLQYILGPDSGWQPIPLTDLISTAAVKKAYRKATLFVHPDKMQQRGASIQQKYVCEKVFDLLKDAWNKFNAEEK